MLDNLSEENQRTYDLINRLNDMTLDEWNRVRNMIDSKFKELQAESARYLVLSHITEEDFYLPF